MPLWCTPMFHLMLPMHFETMLNKFKILFPVIRNVEMVFDENPYGSSHVGLQRKHICTKIVPMHTLDLILHLKGVVFNEINYQHHNVCWKWCDAFFELFVFPSCHKVMFYNVLWLRLHVINELIYCCWFVHQGQLLQCLTRLGHSRFKSKVLPLYQNRVKPKNMW
jgi:hypothetical protein